MLKLLRLLGLPVTLPTGHELGCLCEGCHAWRQAREEALIERVRSGKPPESVAEILAEKKRKSRQQ